MERHYKFIRCDFNENGTNIRDVKFFLDLLEEWELDFHDHYFPFFTNSLFANSSTMTLLNNCFVLEPGEDCGMELINSEIDINTNLEIDKHSKKQTIYAIGSRLDEDEPILLVRDETIMDGNVILKWVPDGHEEEDCPDIPVETEKRKHDEQIA